VRPHIDRRLPGILEASIVVSSIQGLLLVMYSCSKRYIGKVGVSEGIKWVEEVGGQ
jgi:hypothetical protein